MNRSRAIRKEFSRRYTPNSGVTSYLQEINNWAQFVQVCPVTWTLRYVDNGNPRAGFYAIPTVINYAGEPYTGYREQGRSHEEAYQRASQLLRQAGIDADDLSVRWRFSELQSNRGTVHYATPIIYDSNPLWDNWAVIGRGQSQQQAKEESARKLFEHGYCWV
ncbi:hypothetical protein FRC09_004155 [Ceratobasidium sp. 395]|nr:hypothetical protein FRC09_004155 [Ceratobasidium sp. 395]